MGKYNYVIGLLTTVLVLTICEAHNVHERMSSKTVPDFLRKRTIGNERTFNTALRHAKISSVRDDNLDMANEDLNTGKNNIISNKKNKTTAVPTNNNNKVDFREMEECLHIRHNDNPIIDRPNEIWDLLTKAKEVDKNSILNAHALDSLNINDLSGQNVNQPLFEAQALALVMNAAQAQLEAEVRAHDAVEALDEAQNLADLGTLGLIAQTQAVRQAEIAAEAHNQAANKFMKAAQALAQTLLQSNSLSSAARMNTVTQAQSAAQAQAFAAVKTQAALKALEQAQNIAGLNSANAVAHARALVRIQTATRAQAKAVEEAQMTTQALLNAQRLGFGGEDSASQIQEMAEILNQSAAHTKATAQVMASLIGLDNDEKPQLSHVLETLNIPITSHIP